MANDQTKRILISIPTMFYSQRLILEGIFKYVRDRHADNWGLQLDLGGAICQSLNKSAVCKYDGVIANIDTVSARRMFLSTGLPTVLIEQHYYPHSRIPPRPNTVIFFIDFAREGQTAVDYFLSLHFKSFAFVGTPFKTHFSLVREIGFAERLKAKGLSYLAYPNPPENEPIDFAREMPRLAKWLKELPRQTAVFAANDHRAWQVLTAAGTAGIDVPGHIAVLGIDNDEIFCKTASPPLSSIATQERILGYTCGRALEELFKGHPGNKVFRTAHTRVVSRASTDVNAVSDPFVAKALNWAQKHLADGASVDAVAKGIGYSKRMLQTRCRRALGKSLGDEIRQMMLSAAAELLANTDMPVSNIAAECGFTSVSHLSLRFRQVYRQTPLAYRKSMTPLG